jgi:hypothetical protein
MHLCNQAEGVLKIDVIMPDFYGKHDGMYVMTRAMHFLIRHGCILKRSAWWQT